MRASCVQKTKITNKTNAKGRWNNAVLRGLHRGEAEMEQDRLKPDCDSCAALCCIALAFDRSLKFSFDKAAGEVCRNLDGCHACTIHSSLSAQGMGGCVQFDCHGAGQRVTQDLFGGRSWRDEPAIAPAMSAAFLSMMDVHAVLVLIDAARQLPLSAARERERATIAATLAPSEPWTLSSLREAVAGDVVPRARAFLKSLAAEPQVESLRGSARSIR
ncbi:hypothetical protein [uncultured Devosia sp.]|uniref:hypothetical protein n=1 Tax=uncultured Devosia sp. TaxID=211434 RepID=UPI0030ED562E